MVYVRLQRYCCNIDGLQGLGLKFLQGKVTFFAYMCDVMFPRYIVQLYITDTMAVSRVYACRSHIATAAYSAHWQCEVHMHACMLMRH